MVAIKHKKVTGRPIAVSDWDDNHIITGTPGQTIVFDETGVAVEATPGTGGGEPVDLTDYYTKAQIDALIAAIPSNGSSDITPDAFSFVDVTNVALNTPQASNWRQVLGINAPAEVFVTGGQWQSADDSAGTNATTPTAVSGTVAPNKWVRVLHNSSNSNSTGVNTTLTIGGVSDTFTSTTLAVSGLNTAWEAPIIYFVSGNADGSAPVVDIELSDDVDVAQSPLIRLENRSKAGTVLGTYTNTIDATEAAAKTANFNLAAKGAGTNRLYARFEQGGQYSDWSPQLRQGPDDQEPILTSPTGVGTGSTSAIIGVTTDTEEGTLYRLVNQSATLPTETALLAGTAAAVTTAGPKSYAVSGLAAAQNYYAHFMHQDAAGFRARISSPMFTTLPVPTARMAEAGTGLTITEDFIVTRTGTDADTLARGTPYRAAATANHYFEMAVQVGGGYQAIGVANASESLNTYPGSSANSIGAANNGVILTGAANVGTTVDAGSTTHLGVLVKNGKAYFRTTAGWAGDPVAQTGGIDIAAMGNVAPVVEPYKNGTQITVNLGQSAFALGALPTGSLAWSA